MSRHFLVQQQKRIPVESLFILFVTTLWPTHSHTDLVDIAQALLETARDWTVQYSIWIKKMIMELKQTITPQISIAILIDQTIVFRSSQTGVSFVHLAGPWLDRPETSDGQPFVVKHKVKRNKKWPAKILLPLYFLLWSLQIDVALIQGITISWTMHGGGQCNRFLGGLVKDLCQEGATGGGVVQVLFGKEFGKSLLMIYKMINFFCWGRLLQR